MIEVLQFRKSFRAWLLGIAGLTEAAPGGVIYGTPMTPPKFPLVTFALARRPLGDYSGHAWECDPAVQIHAVSPDALDTIEDLVTEWIADDAHSIDATLSETGKTMVQGFRLVEVDADEATVSMEDGSYEYTSRPMRYACALVGLSEG